MPAGDRLKAVARDQLAVIARKRNQLIKKDRFIQFGGGPLPDNYSEFNAMCLAAIDRLTGRRDCYYEQAVREVDRHNTLTCPELAHSLFSLVLAIKRDIEGGSLITFLEIEHASHFGELLDVAEGRASQGNFQAAAGIMGAVLENHLRQLAMKYDITLSIANPGASTPRTRPQQLNDQLAQVAYGETEHQDVNSWLAFAAMPTASKERITEFIQELRDFITRYPA
jgi:hypothetical protein